MTVASGERSDARPTPGRLGRWNGSLPKLELSIPGSSAATSPATRFWGPALSPLVRPPFRFRWFSAAEHPGSGRPVPPIYSLLAMSAGVGDQGVSVEGGTQTATTRPQGERASRSTADKKASRGQPKSRDGTDEADPNELHDLVVEHGDAIYRLALSVVRDQALAEDVAQEALVKAWLALPSFRGDASLRSWLLRITHNTAISTLRRRRAVVIDPLDMPEEPTRIERSVESRVQGEVVMDHFIEALDTLDELSRSIVVLRELEGLSYDEISEVLDVPMPTVKTRLLRARRRLSNVLREWA